MVEIKRDAIRPGQVAIGGGRDVFHGDGVVDIAADGHLAGPNGIVLDPDHNYFVVLKVDYAR